jgi:signal transduction histidine kinase
MQGKTDHDIFPKDMADAFIEADKKVIHAGQPLDVEERVPQDDGIHTYISVKFPLRDSSGEIYAVCGIATDITERKAAENQLRDLSSHLLSVREEEKARIAREIHDELGGTLTSLKMDAYWLSRKLPANEETAELIKRIASMSQRIDNAVSATRRIISDMRPTILDDLGLLAAIEWQAAEFHRHSGVECRVSCIEDEANMDKQYSIALFRILQEALTNVSRHAKASGVEIEFLHSEKEAILSVSDNGRGMTGNNIATQKSYGILGMTERVEQLGGKIIFGSPSGGGFSVTVTLPLPAAEWSI